MAYFALVPAAGSGARMAEALPKQYLPLAGQPMIHHALATLCAVPRISQVFVVLAADDAWWKSYDWSGMGGKLSVLRCGGATRADSVRNGLQAVADNLGADDWVLVHDAARPCLTVAQVDKLIGEIADDAVGGLLAEPVADTLKRADSSLRVSETVSRECLWRAQTPQMFRHGALLDALRRCADVTDEAGAMEALGLRPRLVNPEGANPKVTYPEDLRLAELIIADRER